MGEGRVCSCDCKIKEGPLPIGALVIKKICVCFERVNYLASFACADEACNSE